MTAWFTVSELFDGISLISEPHVDSFIRGNIWWIKGQDRDLIFDCGNGIGSLQQEVPELFQNNPLVVLSHAHPDHCGGAHEFREVHCHRLEQSLFDQTYPGYLGTDALASQLGISSQEISPSPVLVKGKYAIDFDVEGFEVESPKIIRTLNDGDHLYAGSRNFEVLHTPGHTAGSIVLYDAKNRILISGDLLYEGTLLDHCHGSDRLAYQESLKRIRRLDVHTVLPGHGTPFDGTRFRELIDEYLRSAVSV
ncbi:MAG: MBL fold metallo-hydrolase [Canibacter sp.]